MICKVCTISFERLEASPGFSLGLDDMQGDLSPPYMGGQVQGDKVVMGGGEGHIFYGGIHTSNSF